MVGHVSTPLPHTQPPSLHPCLPQHPCALGFPALFSTLLVPFLPPAPSGLSDGVVLCLLAVFDGVFALIRLLILRIHLFLSLWGPLSILAALHILLFLAVVYIWRQIIIVELPLQEKRSSLVWAIVEICKNKKDNCTLRGLVLWRRICQLVYILATRSFTWKEPRVATMDRNKCYTWNIDLQRPLVITGKKFDTFYPGHCKLAPFAWK